MTGFEYTTGEYTIVRMAPDFSVALMTTMLSEYIREGWSVVSYTFAFDVQSGMYRENILMRRDSKYPLLSVVREYLVGQIRKWRRLCAHCTPRTTQLHAWEMSMLLRSKTGRGRHRSNSGYDSELT